MAYEPLTMKVKKQKQLLHRWNNYRNSVGSFHNVAGIWNPWIKMADRQQELHVT